MGSVQHIKQGTVLNNHTHTHTVSWYIVLKCNQHISTVYLVITTRVVVVQLPSSGKIRLCVFFNFFLLSNTLHITLNHNRCYFMAC